MFEQEVSVSPYNFMRGVVDKGAMPRKITVYDSTLSEGCIVTDLKICISWHLYV